MDAGKLDRLITIQAATTTQNEFGEPIPSWSNLADVWAEYLPGGGSERFTAQQVYAETTARFRIRWRSDVDAMSRILFDGKTWDILAVDEFDGRRNGLEIKVKAGAM